MNLRSARTQTSSEILLDLKDLLSKSPVFSVLPMEEIGRLAATAQTKAVRPGETVFLEGDPASITWVVREGRMRITKSLCSGRGQAVEFIDRGGFFGCVGCVLKEAYPCEAVAASPTHLVGVPIRDVLSLVDRYPRFARTMLEDMGQRLRDAQLMRSISMESAETRIAAVLLRLKAQFGRLLPFTRQDIAEMSGTTTETSIRILIRFRKRGWVGSARGRILLIKPAELQKQLDK